MIVLDALMQVEDTFRFRTMGGDRRAIGTTIAGWAESGLTVRVARGRKTPTLPRLFDEFAAAMQFPLYFGENRDAFDECLADLDGLPLAAGFVLVITEPEVVLADDGESLGWLVNSLARSASEWGRPVTRGEWWDRPAIPFHVILAVDATPLLDVAQRWALAGAVIAS